MQGIKLKDVKQGEYFTRKPLECPKESQVYVRNHYAREIKKYSASHFCDVNAEIFLKGDTIVYIDFIF